MMGNQERSAAPTVADSKAAFPPELAGADDGLDEALDQALRILGHSPSTNQKCASSADASGVATNAADRRAKLRVLYSNDAFRAELGRSSREEMQALADSSLFRVLCSCLREGDPLEFAHVGECVCHCIRTVPELVVDAWAFGAVRPIVACLLKKRKLNDKRALLRDSGLQHSLCFVMCMGMPLKAPGCSEAAKNVSRKCIGWFIRQGVFVKVGEVSVALSQSGPECKQEKFLAFVFYAVASLLVAAQYTLSSRGEGAGLEQQKGKWAL